MIETMRTSTDASASRPPTVVTHVSRDAEDATDAPPAAAKGPEPRSIDESSRSDDLSLDDSRAARDGTPWRGPCSCATWPRRRVKIAALGCSSASLILTVRLLLDPRPLAYVIHSIVVFVDMILIHLFTNAPWLSASGEFVCVLSVIAFHLTKARIFELLETVLIAALCSFHLIHSRHKHMRAEKNLRRRLRRWKGRRTQIQVAPDDEAYHLVEHQPPPDSEREKTTCMSEFYEHFLDGSAGVPRRAIDIGRVAAPRPL